MNKQDLVQNQMLFLIWVQGKLFPSFQKTNFFQSNVSFSSGTLERQLRSLIDCVDDFGNDALRYTNYQKQLQRQQSRRNQRDSHRRNDGYDEDFERLTKVYAQSRRNALVTASQINNQCDNISQFTSQGLAKLFMAQAVHEKQ